MLKTKYFLMISFIFFTIGLFVVPNVRAIDTYVTDIADEDSYVKQDSPNSNYGSYSSLYAGIYYSSFDYCETFIHFTFDNQPTDYIKAEISLGVSSYNWDPLNLTVCIIESDWSEYSITWNNKPAHNTVITHLYFYSYYNGYDPVVIDVTDIVETRDELSICIFLDPINYVDEYVYFQSTEGAYSQEDFPQIIWTYDGPINAIPIVMIVLVCIGVIALVRIAQIKVREGEPSQRRAFSYKTPSRMRREAESREYGRPKGQIARFCPKCGEPLPSEYGHKKFCLKCGEKI